MPSLRYGGCHDNVSLNSFDGAHFNDVVEEEEEKSDEDKYSCSSKGDSSCSPTETNKEHDFEEDESVCYVVDAFSECYVDVRM